MGCEGERRLVKETEVTSNDRRLEERERVYVRRNVCWVWKKKSNKKTLDFCGCLVKSVGECTNEIMTLCLMM